MSLHSAKVWILLGGLVCGAACANEAPESYGMTVRGGAGSPAPAIADAPIAPAASGAAPAASSGTTSAAAPARTSDSKPASSATAATAAPAAAASGGAGSGATAVPATTSNSSAPATSSGAAGSTATPPAASGGAAGAPPLPDLDQFLPPLSTPESRVPSPDNPAECPAMAPENPVGDCLGLPIYLECNYGTYFCVCDWYHWLCAG